MEKGLFLEGTTESAYFHYTLGKVIIELVQWEPDVPPNKLDDTIIKRHSSMAGNLFLIVMRIINL